MTQRSSVLAILAIFYLQIIGSTDIIPTLLSQHAGSGTVYSATPSPDDSMLIGGWSGRNDLINITDPYSPSSIDYYSPESYLYSAAFFNNDIAFIGQKGITEQLTNEEFDFEKITSESYYTYNINLFPSKTKLAESLYNLKKIKFYNLYDETELLYVSEWDDFVAGYPWGIEVNANETQLYVSMYSVGTTSTYHSMYILDVTSFSNVQKVGSVKTGQNTKQACLSYDETLLFQTIYSTNGVIYQGIVVIDVTDPTDPEVIRSVALGGACVHITRLTEKYLVVSNIGGTDVRGLYLFDETYPDSFTPELFIEGYFNQAQVSHDKKYLFGANQANNKIEIYGLDYGSCSDEVEEACETLATPHYECKCAECKSDWYLEDGDCIPIVCEEVTVYSECDFGGESQVLSDHEAALEFLPKSVCIPEGRSVKIYDFYYYAFQDATINKSITCLSSLEHAALYEEETEETSEAESFIQLATPKKMLKKNSVSKNKVRYEVFNH